MNKYVVYVICANPRIAYPISDKHNFGTNPIPEVIQSVKENVCGEHFQLPSSLCRERELITKSCQLTMFLQFLRPFLNRFWSCLSRFSASQWKLRKAKILPWMLFGVVDGSSFRDCSHDINHLNFVVCGRRKRPYYHSSWFVTQQTQTYKLPSSWRSNIADAKLRTTKLWHLSQRPELSRHKSFRFLTSVQWKSRMMPVARVWAELVGGGGWKTLSIKMSYSEPRGTWSRKGFTTLAESSRVT